MMTDGYPPPSNPPQGKSSPIRYLLYVLVAIGIVGPVLLIVILAAAGVGIAGFAGTEDGQRFAEGVKNGYSLIVEATNAPGAQEMRDAGCQEAMVTTVSQLTTLVTAFVPEGEGTDEFAAMNQSQEILLFCQVQPWSKAPECGELARVYSDAVDPDPAQVVVMVQKQSQSDPVCSGYYAPDGTRLGSLSDLDLSLVPEGLPEEPQQ
jgi:hypothetical protein